MTPRTIEREFSDLLRGEVGKHSPLNLAIDAPLMVRLHPKLHWVRLQFKHDPQQEWSPSPLEGYYFESFNNIEEAINQYPGIETNFQGRPWALNKFIQGTDCEAIVDFFELGAVRLSKNPLESKPGTALHQRLLQTWLSYALSTELWGPLGKWPRFHESLLKLFNEKNLLDQPPSLGYYPLKSTAQKLADFGFIGTRLESSYLLVLPWDFALSDLKKMEQIIRQEF